MKLLFISGRDVNEKYTGASYCTNRNYLSFCEILGKDNVTAINLLSVSEKSFLKSIIKRINVLFGFFEGLSFKKLKSIIKSSIFYDYVFIDASIYGITAYFLKKKEYKGKIICFFHNVEYNIERQKVKIRPWKLPGLLLVYYNERLACKYSDIIITLNKRDCEELKRIYGINNINVIPISLKDTLKRKVDGLTKVPPTFIFLGNNWFPNVHGLIWFIDNVLDHVNIKLQIVGPGMDKLVPKLIHPKIEFIGFVSDLSSVLLNADFVLAPIFLGSGMKVKTCESLMYGKNIIGTKESFEGYEIDFQKVGAICNNKEEFIFSINQYCSVKIEKFNEYSRECFIKKYSFQATLHKFNELFSK